jgi:hypothetical protein
MTLSFYLACFTLVLVGLWCWRGRYSGWGLPASMVVATVAVWYVGDVFYNDLDVYLATIGYASIDTAWWQVVCFLVAFGVLVQPVHRLVNGRLLETTSQVMVFFETDYLRNNELQSRIDALGRALLSVWLGLMGIGLLRVEGDVLGLFAPYLGTKANPWDRGQIGGGFSAFISLGNYLQIFLASSFGVLAALAMNPRTRNMALLVCFLALPFYIFDRTRNTMLAAVMPGVLAFVFFRLRSGLLTKGVVLAGGFLIVDFWFSTVMANRTGMSFDIKGALSAQSRRTDDEKLRHLGLNMLEELAWIDHFMVTGAYAPNWGQRYFAEIVNPVPRSIWKNKPTIGLDYAVARGQSVTGPNGEVTATISTGLIGQGVVNFGKILGPIAAAALMSLWVALLARQDLLGIHPGRMVLYGVGFILVFNMGRDISLLALYPFFFGLGLLKVWQYYQNSHGKEKQLVLPHRWRGAKGQGLAMETNPGHMKPVRRRS